MSDCRIRFNVHHEGSGLVWRVFVNDVEYKCSEIILNVNSYGQETWEENERKWNLHCTGVFSLNGTIGTINPC